jgi:RNA polymerase sigma factor (sigma-70 family)
VILLKDQLDLIRKARAGDVAARNLLVESQISFIRYVVKGLVGWEFVDEYLTDATLGFIRAIENFDEGKVKSSQPSSYFWSCIKREVLDARRTEGREFKNLLRYREALRRHSGVAGQSDCIVDDEVHKVLAELPESHQYIVSQRMSGVPLRVLALEFGVSKQRIAEIERHALNFVRDSFPPP